MISTYHAINKGFHGWKEEARFAITAEGKSATLSITTMKRSSGVLSTTATVHINDGDFMSHRVFHDFSKTLATQSVRVTEKAVSAQHAKAKEDLAGLLEQIHLHYEAKAATSTN